jgi:uncharacterized protein
MGKKLFFKNSAGLKICGILEEPNSDKKEVVIIVHGYSSNKDRPSITGLADELIRRNINSFRIDLDGCGESEGKFEEQTITSAVDDISSAIELMKKRGYSVIDLLGSSAGGLSVMAAALKHPEIHRIGLRAPVSDYPSQRLRKYGQQYMDDWKQKGYNYYESGNMRKLKINYSFIEDAKKYVMYGKAKEIKCPILIVHGTADDAVDINDSRKLVKGLPNWKLIELEGADHKLEINGDRSESNRILGEWFEKENVQI